jgi:hypothetical protein
VPNNSEESDPEVTPSESAIKDDRRAELRAAAARVRASMQPEFSQRKADQIMNFLRGSEAETQLTDTNLKSPP